jgi:hypothetical protein
VSASPFQAAEGRSAQPKAGPRHGVIVAFALAIVGCRVGYDELDIAVIEAAGGTGNSGGTWSTGGVGGESGAIGTSGGASANNGTGTLPSTSGGNSAAGGATGGSSSTEAVGGNSAMGGTSGGSSGTNSTGGNSAVGGASGGSSSTKITGGNSAVGGASGGSSTTNDTGGSSTVGGASGGSSTATASGGTSADSGGPIPYCEALPHLSSVPVLDGVVDANLRVETVVPVGWSNKTTALPVGVTLEYAAAWHETGFYFFLQVTDPELNPASSANPVWYGDAVEIYVDHDAVFAPPNSFDAVGTREFIVGAPANASSSSTRGDIFVADGIERAWPETQWKGIATTNGYTVEAFVMAADLSLSNLQLSVGQVVGFDLGHDVSYPIGKTGTWGNRLGQYFLQVRQPFSGQGKDCPFIDTSVFCTPSLVGD